MEKTNIINKKKVIGCIVALFVIIFLIIFTILISNDENGINAIVLEENVKLYSKPIENDKKIKQDIVQNSEVEIIDTVFEDNKEWYKVKLDGKKGYVLSENIDYFGKNKIDKMLVADFSSHNFKNIFSTKNDVEAFLLKYDIAYVYIRAGGRGYGKKGNFYTDDKYEEFKNACEYLGIEYGYYFLDEALTNSEIIEEVEYIDNFMNENKSDLCTLPLALDIESHEGNGRCDDIWDTRSELVSKLLKRLDKAGYNAIVYSNANTCNTYLSSLNTKFWLAYYPLEDFIPDYWYSKTGQPGASNSELLKKMIGWQFSESGVKHVIKEGIDLSIFKEEFFDK